MTFENRFKISSHPTRKTYYEIVIKGDPPAGQIRSVDSDPHSASPDALNKSNMLRRRFAELIGDSQTPDTAEASLFVASGEELKKIYIENRSTDVDNEITRVVDAIIAEEEKTPIRNSLSSNVHQLVVGRPLKRARYVVHLHYDYSQSAGFND